MTTWIKKETTGTTSWTFDSNDITTTTWANKTGNTPALLYGSADANTDVFGTYSSPEATSSSIIGGKHHLFDDKAFRFGTDSDFLLEYNVSLDSMNLYSNQETKESIFRVTSDGYILSSHSSSSNPSGNGAGIGSLSLNTSTNRLFIRTS